MNNCKSPPQSTQLHSLPGLTSHLPTSNTKRHMLDFLPCSCCYLSPGCLPLASYLLKISSAHFYLEVSMSLPHKHNWTTSPFSWHYGGSRPVCPTLEGTRFERERVRLSSVVNTIKEAWEVDWGLVWAPCIQTTKPCMCAWPPGDESSGCFQ